MQGPSDCNEDPQLLSEKKYFFTLCLMCSFILVHGTYVVWVEDCQGQRYDSPVTEVSDWNERFRDGAC